MGTILDKIAAQNQVTQPVTPTSVTPPKTATTRTTTKLPTNQPKTTTKSKIASQNTPKTASTGTQKTNQKSGTAKKVTTIEEYNKLAQQKKEERQVKVRDMMTTRNQYVINASVNGKDILEGINAGQVSSDTIDQLSQANPTLYEDYLKVTQDESSLRMMGFISGQMQGLKGYADKIRGTFLTEYEKLGNERVNSKELYDKYVDSEATLAKGETVTQIENEIEELQITMDGVEDDIRSQYDGKASESFIQAMIAKRQKDIIPQFRKLESEYRKAQLDYNSALQQGQVEFQFALEDARYEEQRQADLLQTKYNMTMQAFQEKKETILKGIDFAQQQYFNEKSFDQQVQIMKMSNELGADKAKAMLDYEYALKDKYGLFDKGKVSTYLDGPNGLKYALDDHGNVINTFDPNTAGFQLEMEVERPVGSTNVGRDINNPGNITADGFTSPEAKSNYGVKIGAIGTYKSPNGREYYVFADQESGARALRADIAAKISGGSAHIGPNDSIAQLIKIYTGSSDVNSGYGKAVLNSLGGISGATPISWINPNDIADAIASAEGFGNIKGLGYSKLNSIQSSSDIGLVEVQSYNNPTFKPQDLKAGTPEYAKYQKFLSDKKAVMDNPNAPLEDILYYSRGGDGLTDTMTSSLSKYQTSFNGITQIWDKLNEGKDKFDIDVNGEKSSFDLAPIVGRLQNMNPYSITAESLNALTNGVVSGLARGVYGEVGVLTNTDIATYKQTIPNLKQPEDVQKAVMSILIKRVMNGYHDQLTTYAGGGRDVGGMVGTYRSLEAEYNRINNEIGYNGEASTVGDKLYELSTSGSTTGYSNSAPIVNFAPFLNLWDNMN